MLDGANLSPACSSMVVVLPVVPVHEGVGLLAVGEWVVDGAGDEEALWVARLVVVVRATGVAGAVAGGAADGVAVDGIPGMCRCRWCAAAGDDEVAGVPVAVDASVGSGGSVNVAVFPPPQAASVTSAPTATPTR